MVIHVSRGWGRGPTARGHGRWRQREVQGGAEGPAGRPVRALCKAPLATGHYQASSLAAEVQPELMTLPGRSRAQPQTDGEAQRPWGGREAHGRQASPLPRAAPPHSKRSGRRKQVCVPAPGPSAGGARGPGQGPGFWSARGPWASGSGRIILRVPTCGVSLGCEREVFEGERELGGGHWSPRPVSSQQGTCRGKATGGGV